MPPKVHNRHHGTAPHDAVYVGRGTKWGNPYRTGEDGDRTWVLRKFTDYVMADPEIQALASELQGRDLVCSCAPRPCHADLWLALANGLPLPTYPAVADESQGALF